MHMALHPGMPGFNPSIYAGLPPQGSQMSGDFNLYGQAGMMPGAGGGGMMATTSDPAGSGLLSGAGPGSLPMGGGLLGGGLNSSSMNDFSLLESKPDSDHLHSRMASNSESSGARHGMPLHCRRLPRFRFLRPLFCAQRCAYSGGAAAAAIGVSLPAIVRLVSSRQKNVTNEFSGGQDEGFVGEKAALHVLTETSRVDVHRPQ
jgi:hypothetical protein